MPKQASCILALVAALLAAGCAGLSPADRERAEAERLRAGEALSGFAEAIRLKDAAAAIALVDPELPVEDKARLSQAIAEAVWLRHYTGYRVEAGPALASLGGKALLEGRVKLKVKAGNSSEDRFRDKYVLARRGERWFVASASLESPVQWEVADPPPADKTAIQEQLQLVLDSLKARRALGLIAMLPPTRDAKYRYSTPTFWERITDREPTRYSVYRDLLIVREFEFLRWPDLEAELPLAYVSPAMVVGCIDLPYTWPQGGVHTTDVLHLEVFVALKQGRWALHTLRLHSRAMPGSR